ncbi:MAG: ligase-associated DNA damage response endonuclease PdeM [Pseudomonadota bacterium]
MNTCPLSVGSASLAALGSGALWWPSESLLAVADLHLGRSERQARLGAGLLPPYETEDTLNRLEDVITTSAARTIVFVGDSFDDLTAAEELADTIGERLLRLASGRRFVWVAGNHDPGPVDLPGSNMSAYRHGGLMFRHIAKPGAEGEVSGHYHPKARFRLKGQFISRPCFLTDDQRIVLPAFGTYTGGLDIQNPAFDRVFPDDCQAILTGRRLVKISRARIGDTAS